MLEDSLNVSITELSETHPAEWRFVPGALTAGDLRPYHGRSITHLFTAPGKRAPRAYGVVCGRKFARATGWRPAVDCVFCLLAMLDSTVGFTSRLGRTE